MFWNKNNVSDEELTTAVKKEARAFFGGRSGSHDWDHTLRVWDNCRVIGRELNADMLTLELAAYLHDIGRSEEIKTRGKVCHAQSGAKSARKILENIGISKNRVEEVVRCIERHRSKDQNLPESIEDKVLFDADKLDALGATGIVRLFLFANEVGAGIHNKEKDLSKTDPYSAEDTAFREFYFGVRFLKDKMMTGPGQEMAKARHKFMIDFFEQLFQEVNASDDFFKMLDQTRD